MKTIDIHTHGIGGYDTRTGSPEQILKIAEIQGALGVSAILPTIYSAPIEEMRRDMAAVKGAMARQAAGPDNPKLNTQNLTLSANPASRILGVYLEGPFLNATECGALNPSSFLSPTPDSLKRLIEGFEDIVKIITVAPEMEDALKLIRNVTDMGITVSMGHSNATYEEAEAGFHAGARGITHIFNAMRRFHHREPGIAGFGLANRDVYIEVIADPYHLHEETIRLIFAVKNPEKIIIISDSTRETPGIGRGVHDAVVTAVKDASGILQGGSSTVVESAARLVASGIEEDLVKPCIGRNPENYLNQVPFLKIRTETD